MTPMKEKLQTWLNAIHDENLRNTCHRLMDSHSFFTWPASLSHHHAYPGGLIDHTIEVVSLGWGNVVQHGLCKSGLAATEDVFIAAALWHDFMKIREYAAVSVPAGDPPPEGRYLKFKEVEDTDGYFIGTDYGKHIGHISGSAMMFEHLAAVNGVDPPIIDRVVHCILSHHGPVREWGSPVAPVTLEAWALHHADMLSSRFGLNKGILT